MLHRSVGFPRKIRPDAALACLLHEARDGGGPCVASSAEVPAKGAPGGPFEEPGRQLGLRWPLWGGPSPRKAAPASLPQVSLRVRRTT